MRRRAGGHPESVRLIQRKRSAETFGISPPRTSVIQIERKEGRTGGVVVRRVRSRGRRRKGCDSRRKAQKSEQPSRRSLAQPSPPLTKSYNRTPDQNLQSDCPWCPDARLGRVLLAVPIVWLLRVEGGREDEFWDLANGRDVLSTLPSILPLLISFRHVLPALLSDPVALSYSPV